MSFLDDVLQIEIKKPYKTVLYRHFDNEAAYEVFYNEGDFKDFLAMLVRNGYPKTLQELIDESVSSEYVCFGCSINPLS